MKREIEADEKDGIIVFKKEGGISVIMYSGKEKIEDCDSEAYKNILRTVFFFEREDLVKIIDDYIEGENE